MGAVCSTGGGDAVQPFSAMADSTAVETNGGDEKVSIGAAAGSSALETCASTSAGSSAVETCAAALVAELKVDPKVALRFARARQGNFSKAEPFLRADLAWRAQKTPVIFGALVRWCFGGALVLCTVNTHIAPSRTSLGN